MQTENTVRSGAAAPHSGQSRGSELLAGDFDKVSRRNVERGENRRALLADILSHGPFTVGELSVCTKHFDQQVDWNREATLFPLVVYRYF